MEAKTIHHYLPLSHHALRPRHLTNPHLRWKLASTNISSKLLSFHHRLVHEPIMVLRRSEWYLQIVREGGGDGRELDVLSRSTRSRRS